MTRLLFILCILLAAKLHAHPVVQGALELRLSQREAIATLRVSNEQIFVSTTLGEGAASTVGSFDALLAAHGTYLLRHFSVLADGTALRGELRKMHPPEDRSVKGFTSYVLHFQLPTPAPALVEVRQDLLTEILYAPGNPWEAPLVARVWKDDRPLVEGTLLTAKQPLLVPLRSDLAGEFSKPATGSGRLAWDFFRHGLTHIAAGWDHALFVAALVLALPGFWRVLALVSAFTLAHTITLTLAVLGWVSIRPSMVEPFIAASIVAAALLNLIRPGMPLLGARLAVAFGFGLFHGLGFAGGLVAAMAGFTPAALATAIGAFSIGVEIGHQLVVLPLLAGMALLRHITPARIPLAVRGGGAAICVAGLWLLAMTLR